jgi:hypothetical protein
MLWDYDGFDLEIGQRAEAYAVRIRIDALGDARNLFARWLPEPGSYSARPG